MVFFERSFIALRFWLIKLGLAVLWSLWIADACGVKDRLSPAFTALLCIRGTFFTGISVGKQQVLAALAGTAMSLGCSALFGYNDLALALAVMLASYVCLRLNWESSMLLVLFTLLYSHLTPLGSLGETAQIRVEGVLIGVVVASLINYLFSHFRYRRMYYFRLRHALEGLLELLDGVADAVRRRNLEAVSQKSLELKSLARLVSLLYEESTDLGREMAFRRTPGDLDGPLIPRIEELSRHIESACWHLFGVTQAMVELLEDAVAVPARTEEQLEAVAAMAREAVEAFQSHEPLEFKPAVFPGGAVKLPFFGTPLPEVTLGAELALLSTDVATIRFHTVRFMNELGDAEASEEALRRPAGYR